MGFHSFPREGKVLSQGPAREGDFGEHVIKNIQKIS